MASQSGQKSIKESSVLNMILKGILVAYAITIPAFLIFSFILSMMGSPGKMITPFVYLTTIVSILIAGIVSARRIKRKGWLNGGMVGLVYVIILYLLGGILYKDYLVSSNTVYVALTCIFTGSLGGIIGVNMKKK
jgi:putative membrane protein (TIGR04086 family)